MSTSSGLSIDTSQVLIPTHNHPGLLKAQKHNPMVLLLLEAQKYKPKDAQLHMRLLDAQLLDAQSSVTQVSIQHNYVLGQLIESF
jgi:hypothetical protein